MGKTIKSSLFTVISSDRWLASKTWLVHQHLSCNRPATNPQIDTSTNQPSKKQASNTRSVVVASCSINPSNIFPAPRLTQHCHEKHMSKLRHEKEEENKRKDVTSDRKTIMKSRCLFLYRQIKHGRLLRHG